MYLFPDFSIFCCQVNNINVTSFLRNQQCHPVDCRVKSVLLIYISMAHLSEA